MAKSALHQQSVTFAMEMKEAGDKIAVLAIYPGYVATRLSSFRSKNDMAECMDGVVDVIQNATFEDSGKFLDWKGNIVPW